MRAIRVGIAIVGLSAGVAGAGEHAFDVRGDQLLLDGEPFKVIGLRCSNALISDRTTDELIGRLPLYRTTIRREDDRAKFAFLLALHAASLALILGPIWGGYVFDAIDPRAPYFIAIPLLLIAMLGVIVLSKKFETTEAAK